MELQRMDFETLVQTRKSYPDDSFPANAVRSDREANSDFVRYVGFADLARETMQARTCDE